MVRLHVAAVCHPLAATAAQKLRNAGLAYYCVFWRGYLIQLHTILWRAVHTILIIIARRTHSHN